jgi:hypothetical protein
MSEPAKDEAELVDAMVDAIWEYLIPETRWTVKPYVERDLSAAIRAAGWAVVPGWQPIETAPTDGAALILWPYTHSEIFSGTGPQEVVVGFWSENYGWHNPEERKTFEPTHWMSLPAAPGVKP